MREKRGKIDVGIVLVLALFLTLTTLPFTEAQTQLGCYTYAGNDEALYCQPGISQAEAQRDCDLFTDCDISQDFIPNSDCSVVPECQQVLCKVDCQTHALGWCEKIGTQNWGVAGEAVPAGQENLWCDAAPGCCAFTFPQTGQNFCEYNTAGQSVLTKWVCDTRAAQAGVSNPTFISGVSEAECRQTYCNLATQTPVRVFGVVTDNTAQPLQGVTVQIVGGQSSVTNANGEYNIAQVNPGNYQLQASLSGYAAQTLTIQVATTDVEQDITLSPVQNPADLSGTVTDTAGNSINNARLSWTGPASGNINTGQNGQYQIFAIPPGDYRFRITAAGYENFEQDVTLQQGANIQDFQLTLIQFSGISGTVFRDTNDNKRFDRGSDLVSPAATIYVDGRFRTFSRHPDGNFQVRLDPGTYTVHAEFADFQSDPITVQVRSDNTFLINGAPASTLELFLVRFVGVCIAGNELAADAFTVNHVPGKQQALLQWSKPCPEVLGYRIVKASAADPNTPLETLRATRGQSQLIDTNVEWEKSYVYTIYASYTNAESTGVEGTITLGNSLCEDRYSAASGWQTFCSQDQGADPQTIYSCDDTNQITSRSCQSRGATFYCAPVSANTADCKDAGVCGSQAQQADPFGLYHSRDSCYGTNNPVNGNAANFCYFDSQYTIADTCLSCVGIESCFDYKSQDACEVNSCFTQACQWVDGAANQQPLVLDYGNILPNSIPVKQETGAGYCVPSNYEKTDQCGLCSPGGELFENGLCTAEVCANLGACFSNQPGVPYAATGISNDLSYCASCPEEPTQDASCYSYNTELECTGGIEGDLNTRRNDEGFLAYSQDTCGWQRCSWQTSSDQYSPGSCVKDGDGNKVDDCSDPTYTASERAACRVDVLAPTTSLGPIAVNVISEQTPEVEFSAVDTNQLDRVEYCLTSAQSAEPCTEFTSVDYNQNRIEDTVSVDLLSVLPAGVNGETYKIYYYSVDKYKNQEQRKEAFVFVDNVPPSFRVRNTTVIDADTVDFTVYLEGLREPVSCEFTLQQILPLGSTQTQTANFQAETKEAIFSGLQGVIYDLTTSCVDEQGNTNTKQQTYTFDLEQGIQVIHPPFYGAVAERQIAFEVQTQVGAACDLYETTSGTPIAEFEILDSEGKQHKTQPISGFVEGDYNGQYRVICTELLTGETLEDYFHFAVDFTPPRTQIILTEGSRVTEPAGNLWEEYFVRHAEVDFDCNLEDSGFACSETRYCLGDGCSRLSSSSYQTYTRTINITDSVDICYYSIDEGNSQVFSPTCGTINIDGFGIVLEMPEGFVYQDTRWGVSNNQTFDIQFYTRIPTVECRASLTPGFEYQSVSPFAISTPDANNRFHLPDFPTSFFSSYPSSGAVKQLFVKCLDVDGQLSPEETLYLEYDPSAPQIEQADARPNPIIEGRNTFLYVETDDKTLCRYSDNTDGTGSNDYYTMEYPFPGADRNELFTKHQSEYVINFIGAQAEYSLLTQCLNGAGDLSQVEEIRLLVDYTQLGNIIAISPDGEYTQATSVPLRVETNKNAICEYRTNTSSFVEFTTGRGTRVHEATLSNLAQEKEYVIPVRCRIADHTAEAQIKFTVDRTPPTISSIEDGTYSCGTDELAVRVTTNEENIASYTYQIYEKSTVVTSTFGSRSSFSSRPFSNSTGSDGAVSSGGYQGTPLLEGSVGPELPIKIPTDQLEINKSYVVRITAVDGVGLTSNTVTSNGVEIVSQDHDSCINDGSAPVLRLDVDDSSCTKITYAATCADQNGCSTILYGTAASRSSCTPNLEYAGQRLSAVSSQYFCYEVEDVIGNNRTGEQLIQFPDQDGDGITDSCDRCKATTPGKVVDELGCAEGEGVEDRDTDTDKDGLPDSWENIYAGFDCALSKDSSDSDGNGVPDNLEDYDGDGKTNFEEFMALSHPCLADTLPDRGDEPRIPNTGGTFTSSSEDNLVAWILLILGLLMVGGGIGYLVYYYKKVGKGTIGSRVVPPGTKPSSSLFAANKPRAIQKQDPWASTLSGLKSGSAKKSRQRSRKEVFSSFSKDSQKIPHLESALRSSKPHSAKIKDLAQKYVKNKDQIKQGLRSEEKSVFNKLEAIAKKTKQAQASKVISEKQAKDIFARLKEISKKRKQ